VFFIFVLISDTMADFDLDLSKIVSDKKLIGGASKASKKRKLGLKGSAVFLLRRCLQAGQARR
jgi:hypothetical protein